MSQTDGLVVVDKPPGCTSHDVVACCRRVFGQRRVGHAGTLDPDATGVLLVGLGQATRLLQFLSGLPKCYSGEAVLGVATSTLDAAGTVTGTWDMRTVAVEDARAAAAKLTGNIMQVPPMVSAVKIGGRRLYELARQGVEVERPARPVSVYSLDLELKEHSEHGPVLGIQVECSAGTYVRTLVSDLGALLGGGAHLRALRRDRVGSFGLSEAVTLEQLAAAPRALAPIEAVRDLQRVTVDALLAEVIRHGKVLPYATLSALGASGTGPWALIDERGHLLAVYQSHHAGQAKPTVVLASSGSLA